MSLAPTGFSVEGLEDVEKVLDKLLPRQAQNLARAVNHGVASEVSKLVKKNVKPMRVSGVLSKSVAAKREKSPPDKPAAMVYIRSGKKEKYDGFYWRFVEHGTRHSAARPFVQPAIDEMRPRLSIVYREQFIKKLAAMARRHLKKVGRK